MVVAWSIIRAREKREREQGGRYETKGIGSRADRQYRDGADGQHGSACFCRRGRGEVAVRKQVECIRRIRQLEGRRTRIYGREMQGHYVLSHDEESQQFVFRRAEGLCSETGKFRADETQDQQVVQCQRQVRDQSERKEEGDLGDPVPSGV